MLLITALMVALLIASSSIVSAKGNAGGTIDCALDITYADWGDGEYWFGQVYGPECDVQGDIMFIEDEPSLPGNTMHFVEEFTIWPSSASGGGFIKGKDWGVWNFSTFKFRANGWVTDASPQWDYLVGAHYHEIGVTTEPGPVIYAPDGQMKIAPSNRPLDTLP